MRGIIKMYFFMLLKIIRSTCRLLAQGFVGQRLCLGKMLSPLLYGKLPWILCILAKGERMKNEGRLEFWWNKGTGSAVTKVVATCALPLDYNRERSVCGAFDYISQQRPLGVLLLGCHHLHSSDLVSTLMNKQTVPILLSTRGCSWKIQMMWRFAPQSYKLLNFSYTAD